MKNNYPMARIRRKSIWGVLFCVFALSPPAWAETESLLPAVSDDADPAVRQNHLTGDWPKKTRPVTVEVTDAPIANVLQSISKQLGLGLVINAPEELIQKRTTLRLIRKPARDVLEIVLENGSLKAEIKDGILFVRPVASQLSTAQPPLDYPSAAVSPTLSPPPPDYTDRSSRRDWKDHWKKHKRRSRDHSKDRVQMGKSMRIEADEEVGDAVVVGGSLTVAGRVLGDAVAVGGSVTVEPSAHIRGDAVSVGGSLNVDPGATVEGGQVGIGVPLPLGDLFQGKDGDVNWGAFLPAALSGVAGTFAAFTILGVLLRSVLLFVLALVIVAIMPRRVARVRGYLVARPGYSFLGGLAIMLSFVPLIILLAITLIGIPLIPVALIVLASVMVIGMTSLLIWLGYKIPLFRDRKTQIGALGIGAVVFILINLIPFLGPALLFFASFAAAGACLLSRFGAEPKSDSPAP